MSSLLLSTKLHALNWNSSYIGWVIYVVGALMLLGVTIVGVIKKPRYIKKYKTLGVIIRQYNHAVILFVIGLLIAGFGFIIWTSLHPGVPENVWKVQRNFGLILVILSFPCFVLSLVVVLRDFYWLFHYHYKIRKFDPTQNHEIIKRNKIIALINKKDRSRIKTSRLTKKKKRNKQKKMATEITQNPFAILANSYQKSQSQHQNVHIDNKQFNNKIARKEFKLYLSENKKRIVNLDRVIAIMMLAVGTIILGVMFFRNGVFHSHNINPLLNNHQVNVVLGLNIFFNIIGLISCSKALFKIFLLYFGQIKSRRIFKLHRIAIVHDTVLGICFFGLFLVNLGLISVR